MSGLGKRTGTGKRTGRTGDGRYGDGRDVHGLRRPASRARSIVSWEGTTRILVAVGWHVGTRSKWMIPHVQAGTGVYVRKCRF